MVVQDYYPASSRGQHGPLALKFSIGATMTSVASSRTYTTGADERREETEWFNCSAFGELAETCNQYLQR